MRRTGVLWLLLGVAIPAGCHSQPVYVRPPLHEEYVLPPGDDARFSSPPTYPKETLDNGLKKDPNRPDQLRGPGAGRFGAGAGGGMGNGAF